MADIARIYACQELDFFPVFPERRPFPLFLYLRLTFSEISGRFAVDNARQCCTCWKQRKGGRRRIRCRTNDLRSGKQKFELTRLARKILV